MSVNFCAILGFGYIIPMEQKLQMEENAGENWEDIREHFYYINSCDENTDVLLGKYIVKTDYHTPVLENLDKFDSAEFSDIMTEIFEICDTSPEIMCQEPKLHLILDVG